MGRALVLTILLAAGSAVQSTRAEDVGLIGHWKLAGDAQNSSGRGHHGEPVGVDFSLSGPGGRPNTAGGFDGQKSSIQSLPNRS